jgi:hypothetical protein
MATIREGLLAKAARLVRDPRYLNKKHPDHPQIFAEATRAFQEAYPEPAPENDTTEGNVHVRAYTRIVDGKEVQVSAYDRTQQIAMRGVPLPNMGRRDGVEDVSSNPFHDYVQTMTALKLMEHGYKVVLDLPMTSFVDGLEGVPDLVVMTPEGKLLFIEVKTGDSKWTENQPEIYKRAQQTYQLYSNDPRIAQLGFKAGEALPAAHVVVAYLADANGSVVVTDFNAAPAFPGKRIDKLFKGFR